MVHEDGMLQLSTSKMTNKIGSTNGSVVCTIDLRNGQADKTSFNTRYAMEVLSLFGKVDITKRGTGLKPVMIQQKACDTKALLMPIREKD